MPDSVYIQDKKLNINIWPKQKEFIDADHIDEIFYGGAAGGGKLLKLDGVILTPFGFKVCRDLRVGDIVNNPDGSKARIIQLHPIRKHPKWIVYFHDGTKTEVSREHLWLAWCASNGKKINGKREFGEKSAEVVETQELKAWLDRGYKPLIPVCKEQAFNVTRKWPSKLDPYLLGLLIGDGSIGDNGLSITSADTLHLKKELEGYEYGIYRLAHNFKGKSYQTLRSELKKLKLWGSYSHTKFVPRQFLYADLDSRYALVQGLLDTDGTVDARGQVYFTTTSKQLSQDMQFLIQSLGGTATIFTKTPFCKVRGKRKDCRVAYTLYIKHPQESKLFRLMRKKNRCKDTGIMYRRVIKVEEKGELVGRCLTVSHPNGLYLTNDFIVTHNSEALLLFALKRRMSIPNSLGIIFRRKLPDLEKSLILRSRKIFPLVGAKYNSVKHAWTFPNGSVQQFGFCLKESDVYDHQSAEYHDMGFDELTHFTEFQYAYLTTRVRSAIPGVQAIVRGASNPGNIGHVWVKKRFIEPAKMQKVWKLEAEKKTLAFIPAFIEDNPSIYMNDPNYEHRLKIVGEKKYKALRFGDWDVFEGQFFNEWDSTPGQSVLREKRIPEKYHAKFLSMDWGYAQPACVLWWEVTPSGRIFIYRELYTTKRHPKELAADIMMLCHDDEIYSGLFIPPELFGKEIEKEGGGEPIADLMQEVFKERIVLQKANNARVPGWQKCREYMGKAPDGFPWLQISPNCENLIRTLPAMVHDEHKPEDMDCFVAGTKILTLDGEKNVETIQLGEMLWTPIGYRPVIKTGISGTGDVLEIFMSNGKSLKGTPDHCVYVVGKGLVALQDLKQYDILKERNIYLWKIKKSGIEAFVTFDGISGVIMNQMVRFYQKDIRRYIDRCIWMLKEKFQKVSIFITRIMTWITMLWKIWCVSPLRIMLDTICQNVYPLQVILEKSWLCGERQNAVKIRCQQMPLKWSKILPAENIRVRIVEKLVQHDIRLKNIVPRSVRKTIGLIFLLKFVRSVRNIFPTVSTLIKKLEPVHIVAVGNYAKDTVYSLTVAEAHLYLANGVVVTNTDGEDHAPDAFRYGAVSLANVPKQMISPHRSFLDKVFQAARPEGPSSTDMRGRSGYGTG